MKTGKYLVEDGVEIDDRCEHKFDLVKQVCPFGCNSDEEEITEDEIRRALERSGM